MNAPVTSAKRAASIRQSHAALPDFRSLGVIARILVAANAAGLFTAALHSASPADLPEQFALVAVTLEPVVLGLLCACYLAAPIFRRLPYAAGFALLLGLAAVVTYAVVRLAAPLVPGAVSQGAVWSASYAVALAALLAGYFNLRERAFSPALAEARLQALQARIRPHFLFNSLNAVLSLIRRDPRRAEAALEDLADLFRSVMADTRELVTLTDEITLTRQYLALESLRLGDRLIVQWEIDPAAEAALVPPMLLQPLVENAVYHGIEPGLSPGLVRIAARRSGDAFELSLSNPYHPEHQHRQGNRMALANIGERLALHFDLEATLDTRVEDERFHIVIRAPFRKSAAGDVAKATA